MGADTDGSGNENPPHDTRQILGTKDAVSKSGFKNIGSEAKKSGIRKRREAQRSRWGLGRVSIPRSGSGGFDVFLYGERV